MAYITHPLYATLDHPLFACGGKRGFENGCRIKDKGLKIMGFTLFPAKLKRGSTSVGMPG
jgi:hypothetical protein